MSGVKVPSTRHGEAGFTLLEVIVSLGLFALIAVAGLAMVDGILKVQDRTEARLDRLTDLQRAVYAIDSDLTQVAAGKITGDAAGIEFTRSAPGLGGLPVTLQYQVQGGSLVRNVGGRPQLLLTGVAAVRWRYLDAGWQPAWPADPDQPDAWPRAVELVLTMAPGAGPQGELRRVIVLPARPKGMS